MAAAKCSDEEFISLFRSFGAEETAVKLKLEVHNVYKRRRRIERREGIEIKSPNAKALRNGAYQARIPIDLQNGIVLVGSDFHYWPEEISTAHRAFIHLSKLLKPSVVILNGDVFDGASVSRHPPIGWQEMPSVKQELDAVRERTDEIQKANPKAELYWTLGNHCARFENRLASQASEFKGEYGFTLKDKFPDWNMCMSIWINDDLVVKHRWKGGVHAAHNNTAGAGKSICTGHLHKLCVTPYSDYNGNRFGIDTGTMADCYGPQFSYTEDNPVNWRSGFVVLTFEDGRLLWPEIVHVLDDTHVEFRGKTIEV